MRRIAVIADIHADWPALSSVAQAIEGAGVDRVWCLGDWASGGRQPKRVFDWVVARCERVLVGNHEVFVMGRAWERLSRCGEDLTAAAFAFRQLGRARVDRLYGLSAHALTDHAELVHGALTGPVDGFLTGRRHAERNLALLTRPLLLFAHTHQPAFWEPAARPGALRRRIRLGVEYELALSEDPADRRLLNPGAVCDRDGARWLELCLADDETSVTAVWHQTRVARPGGKASSPPRAKSSRAL